MQRSGLNQARIATVACYAAFLALGVTATLLGPSYQNLTHRFGMPLENGGIFTSLEFFGVTVSVIVCGRLLDRINARYLLCGGTFLMGAGLLLLSVAPTLPIALLATLIVGLGFGALDISPNILIMSLNPDSAGSALNAVNVSFGVGAIIGPQVVNFALAQHNFTLAFVLVGGFAMLLTIPFLAVSVRVSSGQTPTTPKAIPWLALLPFALLLFLSVGAETGFGSWLFTQVTKVTLVTEATATIATSLFFVGLTTGRVLASLALRRLNNGQIMILATIILGSGAVLMLSFPARESVALLSAFIVGFGAGPLFPTGLALFNENHPESRSAASGILIALGTMGAVVFPWVQGQIGAGRDGGIIVTPILALLMLGMVVLLQRQTKHTNVLEAGQF